MELLDVSTSAAAPAQVRQAESSGSIQVIALSRIDSLEMESNWDGWVENLKAAANAGAIAEVPRVQWLENIHTASSSAQALPEGDDADLPVKSIDGLQAHGLDVNVAFAGTHPGR